MNNKYGKFIIALIICTSIVLMCSNNSDNTTLDEVRLRDDIEVSKKQFAMYTRDSDEEEYQEYTGDDLFPKGYKLNETESQCMDNNGEDVTTEEVISQTEDGKIMVTSTKTVYCTFYFDKEITASETLTTNPSSYLKERDHGDLHWRYVGTQEEDTQGNIKNYVCFGDEKCSAGETDNHMYRIIGITEDGKIKIQKNSSIGTSQWYTSYQSDTKWPNSTVYSYLTGNSFYTSSTYVSQGMKEKIEEHKWNTGNVNSIDTSQIGTRDTVYNLEQQEQTHTGEIGLAYLSDYYFAYNEDGTQNCRSGDYCKSWMIPSEYNTLWSSTEYEWTMTRYGWDGNYYDAWDVDFNGNVYPSNLTNTDAVRPVFYLKSEVTISGGEGTSSSPYIIN